MSAQEPGVLVFEAPRRGKPPRHLADLTLTERKQVLTDVGLPGFRAAQLSTHYFDRLDGVLPSAVAAWTVFTLLP